MRTLKNTLKLFLVLLLVISCTQDDDNADYANSITAPTNVSAAVRVTQDNTGLVTITPLGEGVSNFSINFGDGSDPSGTIQPGNSVTHVYEEGTYEAAITASGLNGLTTTITQEIVVSFQAPQNVVVTIVNDGTLSKTIHIDVEADFAMFYEVDFGDGSELASANLEDTTTYTYADAGIYTISVEIMGAAIETFTYTEDFEVTAILQPLAAAPAPPSRADEDLISIFSNAYTDLANTDFYPNWGQSTTYNQIVVDGSDIIQYGNLNYQGIQMEASVNASEMEFLHVDIWTADENEAKISPISSGPNEAAYDLDITAQEWTSFDIPLSYFTDQNPLVDFSDIIQFKFDGDPAGGTIFVDNLYFYKMPSEPFSLAGTWQMAPEAGALGVGPAIGDVSWWNCDATCVGDRSCYYDDEYVFGTDGSFTNLLGTETWLEGWQGGSDACGAPVAPHDGSAAATYTYDAVAGTVTLNGTGAYIGLPKANNQGELPNVAVPSSITYNVTQIDNDTILVTVEVGAGSGVFWQYKLIRTAQATSPLAGTWRMAPEAGALGVGPAIGDVSWWNCDATCVGDRACYYDDEYVFGTDGSFTNVLGSETWLEGWQGGSDACGAPVAPHDGSAAATYTYDSVAGTVTLNGTGAYIGLPKANNQGELPNVAVPSSITYNVSFIDNNNILVTVEVGAGSGAFWQYKLVRI